MKKIKLPKGKVVLVSDCDFKELSKYKWRCYSNGYVARSERHGKKIFQILIHNHIMKNDNKELIADHINGDKLDNRRYNLRLVSRSENTRNSHKQNRKKTSIYKGIYKNKNGKWIARIGLGVFDNEELAAKTYDKAAQIHFGKFGKLNFPIKPKIIILGVGGMLGHVVFNTIKDNSKIDIIGYGTQNYNFTRDGDLLQFKEDNKPSDQTIVVNCAGWLRQKIHNPPTLDDIYNSINLNASLPHFLAENYRLIHISTDCVWENAIDAKENEAHTGQDLYSKTKSVGEPTNRAMVIRTSIIGPELNNKSFGLYEWFMKSNKSVNGYTNHTFNGVTTQTLANCISKIIKEEIYVYGARHIFSPARVSKYELLKLFNRQRKNPIEIIPVVADKQIDRTLSTLYPEFNNQFKIPSISEQIKNI